MVMVCPFSSEGTQLQRALLFQCTPPVVPYKRHVARARERRAERRVKGMPGASIDGSRGT